MTWEPYILGWPWAIPAVAFIVLSIATRRRK